MADFPHRLLTRTRVCESLGKTLTVARAFVEFGRTVISHFPEQIQDVLRKLSTLSLPHANSLLYVLGQPMTPVRLLYPVSRLAYMSSLKHIVRFVIHRQIRRDRIDDLDLPARLKGFLKEAQIYAEHIPSSDDLSET